MTVAIDGLIERVVVVRALPGLGDFLCAVPALRALRSAAPDARITIVVDARARYAVAPFTHLVDEIVDFGGFPGIPESPTDDPRAMVDALRPLQEQPFDLAIQLHGSGAFSNSYTAMIGARRTAGAYLPGLAPPDAEFFIEYDADRPEVIRNLRLMEFLGAPPKGEHLEFPVTAADEELDLDLDRTKPYACMHPGSSLPSRRWPAERFAAVGDRLAAAGLQVVITGSAGEREIAASVIAGMRAPAQAPVIDACGRTSIGALAALLGGSQVVVTNDTGTSHLADAVHAASVVVFMVSDPCRWGPLDTNLHRRVIAERACGDVVVAPPVAAVVREVESLLQRRD